MVGGDDTVFHPRPAYPRVLTGKTIVHMGPNGAGQGAKACNQICTIVNMLGAAEAMLMAERAGIDPAKVKDVLMTGFGASRMLEMQAPKMIARDFNGKPESLRLHHKDIQIGAGYGAEARYRAPGQRRRRESVDGSFRTAGAPKATLGGVIQRACESQIPNL